MSTQTTNLGITFLAQNQANKETLVNEGLVKIDALLNRGAISQATATPPGSPSDGDLYIISTSATGDWSGHDKKVTYYDTSKGWVILTPNEGMTLWVNDEDELYSYDGTDWIAINNINSATTFGINATADTTNRLAVATPAVLFDAETDDIQLKIDKNATGDTGSVLFQTNSSGRAEFGLTGDDDFHVKVSADGSSFDEALVFDKDNGNVHVKQGLSFDDGANIFDQYEEGTFTPTLYGATSAGTTTYDVQDGSYIRIGNLVFWTLRLDWTNQTGSGDARIGGLPFVPRTGNEHRGNVNLIYYNGLNLPTGSYLTGYIDDGQDYIRLRLGEKDTAATEATIADVSTAAEVYLNGMYLI